MMSLLAPCTAENDSVDSFSWAGFRRPKVLSSHESIASYLVICYLRFPIRTMFSSSCRSAFGRGGRGAHQRQGLDGGSDEAGSPGRGGLAGADLGGRHK